MSLAAIAEVSREAFAQTGTVVTFTTARAVTSFGIAIPIQRIGGGRAFNQTAISTTKAIVTLASIAVLCIPCTVVFGGDIFVNVVWDIVFGKLFQRLADPVAVAVTRAGSPAAAFAAEASEAFAFPRFAITFSFTRAFHHLLVVMVVLGGGGPGISGRAGAQGAVSASPGGNGSRRGVLVVRFKASVANA